MIRHVFATSLGHAGLAWGAAGLARFVLPQTDPQPVWHRLGGAPADAALPDAAAGLVDMVTRYAQGDAVDFTGVPVDLAGIDDFRVAIYAAARKLRHGEAVTYGELAARAGHPGLARETGTALGRNPVPLVVPCHRIVAAGGRLGGFSAPGGAASKARLLAHERATVTPRDARQASFAF